MKRAVCVLVFGLMFVLGSAAVQAATPTPIDGSVSNIELCPQFICGFAAFTRIFNGQIGNNHHALGIVSTALNHTPLPVLTTDKPATILPGGVWKLQTLSGTIAGAVLGGSITLVSDKLFHVVIFLITSDAKLVVFDGTLDHHPLIPTFSGSFATP